MSGRRYVEPARTYASCFVLLVILAAGFVVDLVFLGGGRAHAVAWAIAAVLVVGVDALIVYAARSVRSIEVTDDEVRVGESSVQRAEIAGIRPGRDDEVPLLGRRTGEGLPRGTTPLTLQLEDGSAIAVATRFPQRLAAALGAEEAVLEVRPADAADLALLPEIDSRAETLFRVAGIDLPEIPYPVDELHESKAVFVVGNPPVGFVQIDEVDGLAHVQEIAVLPSHMRRGLGSLLLDAACAWARTAGYRAVTLTTYAEVAWNAPFYAERGFVELASLTPALAELRDWERDIGLDAVGRRVAMRRDL